MGVPHRRPLLARPRKCEPGVPPLRRLLRLPSGLRCCQKREAIKGHRCEGSPYLRPGLRVLDLHRPPVFRLPSGLHSTVSGAARSQQQHPRAPTTAPWTNQRHGLTNVGCNVAVISTTTPPRAHHHPMAQRWHHHPTRNVAVICSALRSQHFAGFSVQKSISIVS